MIDPAPAFLSVAKRVGLYLRVSTKNGQTVDNQRQALSEAIIRRPGWVIADEFSDQGISGAKGRDKRPEFDRLLKEVVRGKIDVVAAWSVDRLSRSLQDLVGFLGELNAAWLRSPITATNRRGCCGSFVL